MSEAMQRWRTRGRVSNLRFALLATIAGSLLVAPMLASCAPQAQSDRSRETAEAGIAENSAEKSGDGKLRSDLKPLTDRFPMLAAADSATWMSGTMGSSDAPGPSTYWIDAVIALPPNEYAALKDTAADVGAQLPEGYSKALKSSVPQGALLSSADLTDLFSQDGFSQDGFSSQVVLVDDGKTLVLSTMFE